LTPNPSSDFTYSTNGSVVTITGYTGSDSEVVIPDTIDGLPVVNLGDSAFARCAVLAAVTIPNTVTSIGPCAFNSCTSLTAIEVGALNPAYASLAGVLFDKSQTTLIQCPAGKTGSYAIPESVTNVGDWAFEYCSRLTSVTIPNGVTSIGMLTFGGCASFTAVTIPDTVTGLGDWAFGGCTSLTGVFFMGNCPTLSTLPDAMPFYGSSPTVYYLPGATGWGTTFGDRPTALWLPRVESNDGDFGVRTNQFGFNVTWARGQVVVIEASTDLPDAPWVPIQTNTLDGATLFFSDPEWINHPVRFYRIRSL